jgi:hypothetical protein
MMFAIIGSVVLWPLMLEILAGLVLLPLLAFAVLSVLVDWQKRREQRYKPN